MMKHSIKQKCKYNIWLSCSNIMPLQRSFMKSALPFSCHIYWKKKFKYSSHAIQSFSIKIYYILSNGIHNGVNANVSAKKGMSMNMNNEHHHWQKLKRNETSLSSSLLVELLFQVVARLTCDMYIAHVLLCGKRVFHFQVEIAAGLLQAFYSFKIGMLAKSTAQMASHIPSFLLILKNPNK